MDDERKHESVTRIAERRRDAAIGAHAVSRKRAQLLECSDRAAMRLK
jgi:hypothetical protein